MKRFSTIDDKNANERYFKNSVNEKLDSYVPVFETLTDPNNFPLLFHCVAGKDRTGIVSAFLLGILNVDESVIIEDYLLTNKLRKREMELKEKEIRDRLVDCSIIFFNSSAAP